MTSVAPSQTKRFLISCFLIADLSLNCSLDYDTYNNYLRQDVLYALVAAQVVIIVAVFLLLFASIASTFLFRVGLLGQLLKKFRSVLFLQPIYLILTLTTGIIRYNKSGHHDSIYILWTSDRFVTISHIHKIGI